MCTICYPSQDKVLVKSVRYLVLETPGCCLCAVSVRPESSERLYDIKHI
jgi:hypothetical protein